MLIQDENYARSPKQANYSKSNWLKGAEFFTSDLICRVMQDVSKKLNRMISLYYVENRYDGKTDTYLYAVSYEFLIFMSYDQCGLPV